MAKIPQDTIERVRDAADILDIVSQYVDLKQRGNNYFGLCPFHGEKTPSFSVAPAKQIYHCFGCGAGGNVYSFIMEYQKITFPEAIKVIAERYNISVEFEKGHESSEIFSSLYELHDIAVRLYQNNLFSTAGENALSYLIERGLTKETLKQFKVGLANNSWDQLVIKCKGKGFTQSQIVQSGLFTRSKKGIFDRFRSRIMFPIFHPSGKPIAFGGRVFNTDDPAKYLNSPETPLYKKSNVFYGLQASRDSIRRTGFAILVEGYMDFLQLYQAGIHHVVSVSGTALTSKHAVALGRVTKKIVLLYDGDDAGGKATIRAGWALLKQGLDPLVVRPPVGQDPDDWVRQIGKKDILEKIQSPELFIDFHINFNQASNLTGADRQQYIIDLMRECRAIEDGIIRNDIVHTISEKLLVDEQELIRTMKSLRINPVYSDLGDDKISKLLVFTSKEEKAQVELLQLLSHKNIEIKKYAIGKVSLEYFTTPLLKKLAGLLLDSKLAMESAEIIEYFQDKDERDSIVKILFNEDQNISSEQIVYDCMKILKSEPIKEEIRSIRVEMRDKESKGEDPIEELDRITMLREKLNEI